MQYGVPNKNDEIRDRILRHLYAVHEKAKSPKSAGLLISQLQKAMRTAYGYKQQEVASNLDYLVQKGWVREVVAARSFQTKGGTTLQAARITYKISDVGLDRLQGASTYRREEHISRVNVTNVAGVTVIGDGNIVNAQLTDLSRILSDLEQAVAKSEELSEEDRLDVLADVATIQSQIEKPKPNQGVIKTVWGGIEKVVTAGEFAVLVAEAARLIGQL